jgi:hypothetical protein
MNRRGERIKENDRGSESKIYCKHFCKCHNVHPVQQYGNNKNKIKFKKF